MSPVWHQLCGSSAPRPRRGTFHDRRSRARGRFHETLPVKCNGSASPMSAAATAPAKAADVNAAVLDWLLGAPSSSAIADMRSEGPPAAERLARARSAVLRAPDTSANEAVRMLEGLFTPASAKAASSRLREAATAIHPLRKAAQDALAGVSSAALGPGVACNAPIWPPPPPSPWTT